MTQLLERAFLKAQSLSPAEQDELARRWLEELEGPLKQASNDPRPASAYDLVKHVVGSLEGPGDMSTNPEYLEDLGEGSMQ